ncbi:hypothetical protein Hsw_PA0175 (plasmid) [Hymenobacter swuensis DY53]|uniref:Resolvase/invertase-type recombinase catalytic domain-containing protein n=1 Tax=Hymenobacter swuensis DY53 TaxID=1227739 RepID=W8ESK6_9BACT|nr:hypothetical protein Hsw_PA0175 [Hymenobacter swuensis DY53]
MAEFERKLIRERTHAGLAATRVLSRVGEGLSEEAERTATVAETFCQGAATGVNEIAQGLRICKVTLYPYLRHRGVVIHSHRKTTVVKSTT